MSSDFEWHFGDELPDEEPEEGQREERMWRRWVPWLLALFLIAGTVAVWWRGRQRGLAEAEAQVQQVAQLEFRALTEGDEELFLSLQDPSDRSWKASQAAYVDSAGLPLPLQGLTTPISTSVESARVVGERARVEVVHTSRLPTGEEASFRAVRFYRYTSDGRWLHTRMDPDAGGRSVTFVVDEVEITALDEDADWIDPLASRLADAAYRFCRLISCGQDLSLDLNLAADLEEAAEPDDAVLPAPFLVGAPENDAARAAWETSLGQFVVDVLATREIGRRPEDDHGGELVQERLRAWLKAKLRVSQPTALDRELLRGALQSAEWVSTWRLWTVPPDAPNRSLAAAEIDLMLAFIEEEHGPSAVAELIHSLQDADYVPQLMSDVNGRPWSTFEARYVAYVREQTAESADDLAAFAAYDLVFHCSDTVQSIQLSEIWGWRLDQGEPVLLSARAANERFTPLSWSPDGARLLVQAEHGHGDSLSVLHARSAEPQQGLIPSNAQPIRSLIGDSGWSPYGKRLAYHVYREVSGSARTESRIVDTRTGEEVVLDGTFIAWSPHGSNVLYATPAASETQPTEWTWDNTTQDFFTARRDATASRLIGEGRAAAWSPNGKQIAYVSAERALTVYDVTTGGRTTLMERDALEEALGFTAASSSSYGTVPYTLAWSPDGEWVALGASRTGADGPEQGAIALVQENDHHVVRQEAGAIYDLAWSPTGRWLRALVFSKEQMSTTVIGQDGSLITQRGESLASWSPDGHLLLITGFTEQGFELQILEVATGKRQDIDTTGLCSPALWNPRSPVGRPTPDD